MKESTPYELEPNTRRLTISRDHSRPTRKHSHPRAHSPALAALSPRAAAGVGPND